MQRFTIIDGKSVFYRGYYAMRNLSLPDGTPTGAVYGFATMLIEIIEKLQPDCLAVAWDKSGTNVRRRKAIYADYKANRKTAPDDFYAQIPLLMELLQAFHLPLYECDDFEADDIMGTLARQAAKQNFSVDLISGDFDMLQIVDHNIHMYQLRRGFTDVVKFDIPAVEAKYGLKKDQFLDLKSLKGDSSDNIPGVPGIGEKTAIRLLQEYGDLENLYRHIEEITGSTQQKLIQGRNLAYISQQLAKIMFDAPVNFNPTETNTNNIDPIAVVAILRKLEFRTLVRRFSKLYQKLHPNFKFPDSISAPSVAPSTAQLSAPTNNTNETHSGTKTPDSTTHETAAIKKHRLPENLFLSWNVKTAMHEDANLAQDILAGRPFWDLGQVAFLLDPLARKTNQTALAFPDQLEETYWQQRQALQDLPKLYDVATKLDFPLIPILYKMEEQGILINPDEFAALKTEFTQEIHQSEVKIYDLAGCQFNVNSPLQLAEILYGKLQLPTKGIKKNQRSFSTGQKELDKLRNLHPIIPEIEHVREISKLLSTYVEPIPLLADQNHRIHTTYTQDVTATGRLSSVNPNLQNIPVRNSMGKRIRHGFIAAPGNTFISADYAQFELRLAAALANDTQLIADFNADIDIHTKTASDSFNIPQPQVTKEQRRAAKVINFGVLYGMSAKGLSEATNMTISEAKKFIDQYFALRSPIRQYLDHTLEQARQQGYVETLFGRRRPTPDVKSPNFSIRSAAERAAANMPIQGTEADLMKRAMIEVQSKLPPDAHLILQIHDSLIIECPNSQTDEVSQILQETMENIAPELPVKLSVDLQTGQNWGDL